MKPQRTTGARGTVQTRRVYRQMSNEISRNDFELFEYLIRLRECIHILDYGFDVTAGIDDKIEAIKSERYRLAVMGEFNRGKSTFINAMLGASVLPTKMLATTAVTSRITYSAEKSATVYYKSKKSEAIEIESLVSYVTKLGKENEKRASEIEEVTITYPNELGQKNIDIYDTPGLNDTDDMTEISERISHECDTVLVVIMATSPFSETECRFVCSLIENDNIRDIVFAVTFIDTIGSEDEIDEQLEYIREKIPNDVFERLDEYDSPVADKLRDKAQRLLGKPKLYGVSCSEAMNAIISNNEALLKKSRFPILRQALIEILIKDKYTTMLDRINELLSSIKSSVAEMHSDKLNHFNGEISDIDDAVSAINVYIGDTPKSINKLIFNELESHDKILKALDEQKKVMLSVFLRGLGSFRDNSAYRLALLLRKCTEISEKLINELDTDKKISSIYSTILEAAERRHSEFYSGIWDSCVSHCAALPIRKPLSGDNVFDEVKFKWLQTPDYNRSDLLSVNIIEPIKIMIAVSVDMYIRELMEASAKARKRLFELYANENAVIAVCRDKMNALKQELTDKRTVYVENYKRLSPQIESIERDARNYISSFMKI